MRSRRVGVAYGVVVDSPAVGHTSTTVHQYNSNNNQRFCTAAAEVTRYIQTDGGA